MAMIDSDELESVAEPVLRQIHPKPFHWDAIDPEKITISYDRPSDTLLVHLFGRGRPSISVPIDRYLYVMVDPDTEDVIGIHIEGFLAQAVPEHPQQIAILDFAELRGMTPGEVRALQRERLGLRHLLAAEVRAALARRTPEDKTKAVSLLLGDETTRLGLHGIPAA
jgi:hypothetical protein